MEREATTSLTQGANASLSNQGRAVVACVAAGELPVGQGAALLSAIGSLARVVEVDELVRRVEALESGVEAHRA